jgi:hypothetical protein
MTGLVEAGRLTGGADKEAGEEIAHGGVALPMQHQRFEQVGAAQEGAVVGRCATHDDMIAAAGAGMAAIDHEFVGAQPRQAASS